MVVNEIQQDLGAIAERLRTLLHDPSWSRGVAELHSVAAGLFHCEAALGELGALVGAPADNELVRRLSRLRLAVKVIVQDTSAIVEQAGRSGGRS